MVKPALLTLCLIFLANSSNISAEQAVNDISNEQLVNDIVKLEGIAHRHSRKIKELTELAGGQLPDETRKNMDRQYQQVMRGLIQLNEVAAQRFSVNELEQEKKQTRVRQLERSISNWEALIEISSSSVVRKNLEAKKKDAQNELRLLKNKSVANDRVVVDAPTEAFDSLVNREPAIPNSRVKGVWYQLGKLKTKFDFVSGLAISKLEGGGAYLLLNDGTALKNPGAPSDINYQVFKTKYPSSVQRLEDLDIPIDAVYPPLSRGYTLDIFAKNNTPGATGKGPTFRALVLTKDGRFEKKTTNMMMGPEIDDIYARSNSTTKMSGTYFIDGNTIELQYYSGEVVRTLFATNGKDRVVLGEELYRVPDKYQR